MEKRIAELTVYLRGWINYFGIGQGYQNVSTWIIGFDGDYACVTGKCGEGHAQKSEV